MFVRLVTAYLAGLLGTTLTEAVSNLGLHERLGRHTTFCTIAGLVDGLVLLCSHKLDITGKLSKHLLDSGLVESTRPVEDGAFENKAPHHLLMSKG